MIGVIDADMVVGEHVVEQAIEHIAAGAGSVVVPERSFAESYWAKVGNFECSVYVGTFEWPRFSFCGGYDEGMVAMEDTDLGLRAGTRARVGGPANMLLHDEGALTVLAVCRKKAAYVTWVAAFRSKHGSGALLAQSALGMGVLAFERRRATGCRIRPAQQGFEAGAQHHCGSGSAQVTAQVRWRAARSHRQCHPAAIRPACRTASILTSNIGKRIVSNLFFTLKQRTVDLL